MHFVETMRGQLTDGATGQVYPVCFHVRAERRAGGLFLLTGVVHAAPWVPEGIATGTLSMSVLPPRLAYDVRFEAADGRALRLAGTKHPSPRAPLESMAALDCTLEDATTRCLLARGQLRFDLSELPKFLASWLPGKSREHRRLDAQHQAVLRRELIET